MGAIHRSGALPDYDKNKAGNHPKSIKTNVLNLFILLGTITNKAICAANTTTPTALA